MHRDLKLSNILLTEGGQVKIIDFGLAVQLSDLTEERETLCGTPNYISPEVILNKPYGLQADLWSLGCIMYAMMTGKPPFECATVQDTLVRIKSGRFVIPNDFSEEAADLINKLLTQDPSVRTTVADVLNHAFLKRYQQPDPATMTPEEDNAGIMMLTDLASQQPGEAGGATDEAEDSKAASLDDMLGFQTLDATDRRTNRNSALESEDRHCEETPGFKRGMTPGSGTIEDSACHESMQSSIATTCQDYQQNSMMQSTMRKSDQYKRKSSVGPTQQTQASSLS